MEDMYMKDKLKGFFGGEETPEVSNGDEGYYTTSREEFHEQNGMAGSKMMLLEPRAYSESQQIADYLKNRSAVVVNLKRAIHTLNHNFLILKSLSGTRRLSLDFCMQFAILGKKTPNGNLQFFFYWLLAIPFLVL